jgi:acyl-CoA thioester hydrolase
MIETNKGVVHPWLCDVMGHLTTRHYTAMFDDASYHLVHACGVLPSHAIGFVDAQITLKFNAELTAGSLFYIKSRLLNLGNKSFTALHTMFNSKNDSPVASAEAISVLFDLKLRQSIPLPDSFRTTAITLMQVTEQ